MKAYCIPRASLVVQMVKNLLNAGDLGLIPGLGRSPGEGKGCSLQYSGLENSMNSIVHGVAKSRIWPSNFHFTGSKIYCKAVNNSDSIVLTWVINQWNRIENLEINPYSFDKLILTRMPKQFNEKWQSYQHMVLVQLDIHIYKNKLLILTSHCIQKLIKKDRGLKCKNWKSEVF